VTAQWFEMRFPIFVFLFTFIGLLLSLRLGVFLGKKQNLDKDSREDFNIVLGGTLTLLGLIIGFTFSMAVSRYDLRKSHEEDEANAIGTEFLRVEVLPAADGPKIQDQLKKYLELRIAFYKARDSVQLEQINQDTERLQAELWSATRKSATAQPTALSALSVSGMNDVLNTQGYTQAAWLNRIPYAAWLLMVAIAFLSSLLIGIGAHKINISFSLALPLVTAIAFFLIADLDSPRGGLIRLHPENLASLSGQLNAH
jgi:hypothetical protein